MSQFDEELTSLVKKVQGAKAAILMGFDGIPVSEVNQLKEQVPLQDILVEYGRVLVDAMKVAQGNDLGAISEITISTDTYRIILQVVDSSYYVGLFLSHEGNVGQGRYQLRQSSHSLKDIL